MNALALARRDDLFSGSKLALRRSGIFGTFASALTSLQPSNDVEETFVSYDELASGSLLWTQKDPSRFAGGFNLYRYADNDPVNYVDITGRNPGLAAPFLGAAATAAGAFAAAGASIGLAAYEAQQLWNDRHTPTTYPPDTGSNSCQADGPPTTPPAIPDFNDPTTPPGPDWTWNGPDTPGGPRGGWVNPENGESLHPDLGHGGDIGSHWDWNDPYGGRWRIDADGNVTPK